MKKYEKIYEEVFKLIQCGEYRIDSLIPTEQELCEIYDSSRVTIRKALFELEKDGYIRKQQGKGSIVVRDLVKKKTVLLILPNIFKYIFADLIKGIESTLREHDISLLIANSFNDQSIERNIIRNHIDMVDAIIFEPAQVNNAIYKNSKTYSKLLSKPTVCINATIPDFDIPSLTLLDQESMELVTRHVISQDVNRVLILSKTDDLQGHSRLQGIKNAFNSTNINTKIVEFNTENEQKKLEDFAFLYLHFKPNCIMFYNDEYAYEFMNQYNINPIVDNILITGFDNTKYSNGYPYTFISPNHPKEQMGIDAANMIIGLLDNKVVTSYVYDPDITIPS